MAISRWLAPLLMALSLAACAATPQPPSPARVSESGVPITLSTTPAVNPAPAAVSADPGAHADQVVLWGGHIVSVENTPPWTRIEVEARPLSTDGRPDPDATGQGRFFAELAAPFDPALFAVDRPLTVAGRVRLDAAGLVVRAEDYYLWDTVDMPLPPALTRRPPPRRPACHHCFWPRPYGFYSFDHGFGGGLRWPYGFGIGYGSGWGWGASIGF